MNLIRKIKSTIMPPCPYCAHCIVSRGGEEHRCTCKKYLDHVERVECVRYRAAYATLVRGTKWCRFKQYESDEEQS